MKDNETGKFLDLPEKEVCVTCKRIIKRTIYYSNKKSFCATCFFQDKRIYKNR